MAVPQESKVTHILAVDDVSDNLFLLETLLDAPEYQFTCVESGRAALEAIYASPPDLVLLDLMMPDMDGCEVTRRIRADETLPYFPILLITAYESNLVADSLRAGADDFIRKPIDIDELEAAVRSLLHKKYQS